MARRCESGREAWRGPDRFVRNDVALIVCPQRQHHGILKQPSFLERAGQLSSEGADEEESAADDEGAEDRHGRRRPHQPVLGGAPERSPSNGSNGRSCSEAELFDLVSRRAVLERQISCASACRPARTRLTSLALAAPPSERLRAGPRAAAAARPGWQLGGWGARAGARRGSRPRMRAVSRSSLTRRGRAQIVPAAAAPPESASLGAGGGRRGRGRRAGSDAGLDGEPSQGARARAGQLSRQRRQLSGAASWAVCGAQPGRAPPAFGGCAGGGAAQGSTLNPSRATPRLSLSRRRGGSGRPLRLL